MNNFEFFADILENINLFFGLLIFSLLLHFILFYKYVRSFLDPYFIAVFSSAFCFTDVFFMFLLSKITTYVFLSYILTQIGFLIGFYTFRNRQILSEHASLGSRNINSINNSIAFYFFSGVYLFAQSAIYATKGIPLFMASRLETFADGGGAGILGRITEVASIFALYAFFLVIGSGKFKSGDVFKYIIVGLIFFTFVLSGSKSTFLNVFYVFWCYIFFARIKGGNYQKYLILLKNNIKKIIGISIALVCLIIYVQSKNNANEQESMSPLLEMAFRFVYSGDIYWYSYPNNVYLTIPNDRGFSALFSDVLGLFRIVDWSNLPEVIGLTMKRYHHPSDVITGSNARHNVFGLIYFGFVGSIIFSYILGLILSFIRNKLPLYLKNTFLGGGLFTYLIIKTSGLDTDPQLAVTYLDNLIFIFPIMFLCYLLIVEFFKVKIDEKKV